MTTAWLVGGTAHERAALELLLRESFLETVDIAWWPQPESLLTHLQGAATEPDFSPLLLLDLDLPESAPALQVLSTLRARVDWCVGLVLDAQVERIIPAMSHGLDGYLLRDSPEPTLVEDFQALVSGRPPLSPGLARACLDTLRREERDSNEIAEVLQGLSRGYSRREVALRLGRPREDVDATVVETYARMMRHRL